MTTGAVLAVGPQIPTWLTATGRTAVGKDDGQTSPAFDRPDPAAGNLPLLEDVGGLLLKVGRHFAFRDTHGSLGDANLEHGLGRKRDPRRPDDASHDQDFAQL